MKTIKYFNFSDSSTPLNSRIFEFQHFISHLLPKSKLFFLMPYSLQNFFILVFLVIAKYIHVLVFIFHLVLTF